MTKKRFLDEDGLSHFCEYLKEKFNKQKLYLHTIIFLQSISSPEGEPFDNVYLFVITTDPTPAVINIGGHYGSCGNLSLKFAPSQILAAYGGWDMDINGGKFNLPVELCISHPIPGAGFENATFIAQAVIPAMEARCGTFEGYSTSEVVLDRTKFIGDTVTNIEPFNLEIISFTVGSTNHQAVKGMTWNDWVASAYNTEGYYILGYDIIVTTNVGANSVMYNSNPVLYTDFIIDGAAYTLNHAGGGNP